MFLANQGAELEGRQRASQKAREAVPDNGTTDRMYLLFLHTS